jgi:hypothetical protein
VQIAVGDEVTELFEVDLSVACETKGDQEEVRR